MKADTLDMILMHNLLKSIRNELNITEKFIEIFNHGLSTGKMVYLIQLIPVWLGHD